MSELIANATRILQAGPPLRLAILFGSHAKGRARADSDADIAILPRDPALGLNAELELAGQLVLALRREIDIVRIDHASTYLRWQIARDGIPLIADPAWELVRFRANAASEHADIAEGLERAAELFRLRITRARPLTDKFLVLKKLAILREHLGRVRRRRPDSLDAFEADVDVQDALAMSLVVAVQEACEVALHLAADEGWGLPGSYAEAFELLARNGVLTAAHAGGLVGTASVRNRLVHGYATVDPKRLWNDVSAGVDALERYVEAIATFVDTAA